MEYAAMGALILVVVALIVLHARTLQAHAVERERLTQLALAKDGREYAQLRKASADPKPAAEPTGPVDEVQIGMGG